VANDHPRERLTLEPDLANDPEVGRWLAAMQDSRADTLRELEGVTPEMVDARPPGSENSIGATLYHVAIIEADWLVDDLFGERLEDSDLAPIFPTGVRDEDGTLKGAEGITLDAHLERLAHVRGALLGRVAPLTIEEFTAVRARDTYDVSGVWVIHHLLQHESEHRAELGWLRRHSG
jgi:uncharacterized damage-inducible protein DinB